MRKFLFKLLTPMVLVTMVAGNLFVNADILEEKTIQQEVEEFFTQEDGGNQTLSFSIIIVI